MIRPTPCPTRSICRPKAAAPGACALATTLCLLLAACGGAETKTGSGGTGRAPEAPEPTVASGPLSGLGPLEVGGATLQEGSVPTILNSTLRAGPADLRLGMGTNANGSASLATGTGTASGAVAQSVAVAPAASVDAGRGEFSLLNLRFSTDLNTLYEGVESLAQVVPGDEIEAFGLARPGSQSYHATRVVVYRPARGRVELLGTVDSVVSGVASVQGLSVNLVNAQVSTTGAAGLAPQTLAAIAPGTLVRVSGSLNPATGGINAASIVSSLAPARNEGDAIFVEGFVREVTPAGRYRIADVEVDASGVTLFAGSVSVGTRLKVRGKMRSGQLRAEQAEIVQPGAATEYSMEGLVSDYTTLSAFVVRGEKIDASQSAFVGGTASNLANGRTVRIKGRAQSGRLVAREITILN